MLSQKIERLVQHFDAHFCQESVDLRLEIYQKVYEECVDMPQCLKIAKAYSLFLKEKPVVVQEFDLFAGNPQHYDMRPSNPLTPSQYSTLTQHEDAKTGVEACKKYLPAESHGLLDTFIDGMASGIFNHIATGHVVSGFNNYMKMGYPAYREKIVDALKQERPQSQIDYLNAMLTVLDAAIAYHIRYAQAADKALEATENADYKANLRRISDACRALSQRAPETFFEAVQSTILLQEMLVMETASCSMSLGRLDQVLNPFYEADGISFEEAQELIYAWRIKISGINNGYQNLMIFGCDENGKYAGNDVSLMFLRAQRDMTFDQPLLSMRYTDDFPDDMWEEVMQTIAKGDGFPAIFYDPIVIEAKRRAGVAEEDLYDYSVAGCVEITYGGKEYSNTEQLRINWLKILELIMNDGHCNYLDRDYPMADDTPAAEISSFEELYERYKRELIHFIDFGTDFCTLLLTVYHKVYPAPLLSIFTDDCIEKGLDIGGGGAKYSLSTINNGAMASLVDSLMVIKKLVFEDKLLTLPEFAEILRHNFEGHEDLRAMCLNFPEKFGNDLEAPDAMMEDLVDFACNYELTLRNSYGGVYMPGMYSSSLHAVFGASTGASADGRLAGAATSNSFCPVQGMDVNGPTAAINSVTRSDHTLFSNGQVMDLKFNSTFLNQETHRKMFKDLVRTYFKQGGMELQFNIVDRETLINAQKHPEQYKNLIVRVSGYSAYFVSLAKNMQDDIIARTQYAG